MLHMEARGEGGGGGRRWCQCPSEKSKHNPAMWEIEEDEARAEYYNFPSLYAGRNAEKTWREKSATNNEIF